MTVLDKLASSLDRRDEIPNQELAREIVTTGDEEAVTELMGLLNHKDKAVLHDCIKVLYEIGEQRPQLIAKHWKRFLTLLEHKDNRLQWGAMTALGTIARERPKEIHAKLPLIMDAADKGSVITRDHAVNILIQLAAFPKYAKNAFALLNEQLLKSPVNQLPMYAERSLPIITDHNKTRFVDTLQLRLKEVEKESRRKRIEKVLKKVMK
ncbi:hypothetical protein WIW50_10175 [Flavobacteriaceae bacterium 3-367]